MIQLAVELSNLDTGESKILMLPCNLRAELPDYADYIILSCTPYISITRNDEIERLNDVLDEINSENPSMTEDYLALLVQASSSGDLFDEKFVRLLKENDFIFEDISDARKAMMNWKERAAWYMLTTLAIPFSEGVNDEVIDTLSINELEDYICWDLIWEQYEAMGFQLIEKSDLTGNAFVYIIHIR